MNNSVCTPALLLLVLSLPSLAWSQGSLTPPGGPAPTMQTLDQLGTKADQLNAKADAINARSERRIPLNAEHTPGDPNYEFIITQAGSYYLTGNLNVAKPNGISILAAGATVDLNGFQISRGSGSGGDGIQVRVTANRTTIKNGTITGFANGIHCLEETIESTVQRAYGGVLAQITVSGCSANGFLIGDGWQFDGCTAYANAATGIRAGRGASIARCVGIKNGGTGIFASIGSSIVNSTARGNGGDGVSVFSGSNISHCVSTDNESAGFSLTDGSCITDSTASGNKTDGIRVSGVAGALVRGNLVSRNGFFETAQGAGIRVSSADNRIEGNNCVENDRGIHVTGSGNLIVKNTASGNGLNNYQIGPNNRYGPIIDLTASGTAEATGDSATGTLTTTTNPWANFAY